ncbi:MAG: hypothetical protein HOD92_07485 [Deltaproteobacteria bacterium]|jgi:trimethylamine---corrinoid protein Co-methyltransferase|nr:hypothetical protein [Deltaproteobacteria bacterium]MBT4526105.1 hypothetical protein [Deltaproteobacteria bacterium]
MRSTPSAGINSLIGWGLNSLTEDQMERLHVGTLEIMQSTGLLVDHDEALKILEKGGCWVNHKTKVVRFPKHLVNEAIRLSPSNILLAGRDPKNDFMMGGKNIGFTSFGTAVQTEDLETGEIRESTLKDVKEMAILCDALENVDIYTPPVSPTDMPDSSFELHAAAVSFTNTSKHIDGDAESGARCKKVIEMAAAIVGGTDELKIRPIISFGVCPTSPLQLIGDCCDVLIEASKNHLPINVLSMAMSGASTPIPLASTIIVHNAEVLAGIVLAQITNPGTPVIYGSSTTTFYMKHGTATVGAPEMAMISAAAASMAHYYKVPCYVGGT